MGACASRTITLDESEPERVRTWHDAIHDNKHHDSGKFQARPALPGNNAATPILSYRALCTARDSALAMDIIKSYPILSKVQVEVSSPSQPRELFGTTELAPCRDCGSMEADSSNLRPFRGTALSSASSYNLELQANGRFLSLDLEEDRPERPNGNDTRSAPRCVEQELPDCEESAFSILANTPSNLRYAPTLSMENVRSYAPPSNCLISLPSFLPRELCSFSGLTSSGPNFQPPGVIETIKAPPIKSPIKMVDALMLGLIHVPCGAANENQWEGPRALLEWEGIPVGVFMKKRGESYLVDIWALLETMKEVTVAIMEVHERGAAYGELSMDSVELLPSEKDRRGFQAKLVKDNLEGVSVGADARANDIRMIGFMLWEAYVAAVIVHPSDRVILESHVAAGSLKCFPPEMPRWYRELVQRCLRSDSQTRPKSSEVLQDLDLIQTKLTGSAGPSSLCRILTRGLIEH